MIYSHAGLFIRDSIKEDIEPIALNMRDDDAKEIWLSNNLIPKEALEKGLYYSKPCFTAEFNDNPIAMFGLVPVSKLSATIWFLASTEADSIPTAFGRASKFMIAKFLEMYPMLHNYVYAQNHKCIEWLSWLGAKFENAAPYGIMKQDFRLFTIQKEYQDV